MMVHLPGQALAVGAAAPSNLAPKGRSWMSIFKRLRDDLGFMHNPLLPLEGGGDVNGPLHLSLPHSWEPRCPQLYELKAGWLTGLCST